MPNEYREGRRALKANVVGGVRDALREEVDPEQMELASDGNEGELIGAAPLPVDGISVRVDPTDRTAWLVTVKIPRHAVSDGEAMILSKLED